MFVGRFQSFTCVGLDSPIYAVARLIARLFDLRCRLLTERVEEGRGSAAAYLGLLPALW